MKSKKIGTYLTLLLTSGLAYADYPASDYLPSTQTTHKVQICLSVNDNNSPYAFKTSFLSTNMFDGKGVSSANIMNGRTCAEKKYWNGVARITMAVGTTTFMGGRNVHIILDSSCQFWHPTNLPGVVSSNSLNMQNNIEYWHFNLTKIPATKEFKYNFKLECTREW